jgi:hypothetical protein
MVDKDLETLYGEPAKFSINGEKVSLRDLIVEEHFKAEFKAQQIDQELGSPFTDDKQVKKLSKGIREYFVTMLDISPAEAAKARFNDYKRFRKFLSRQDMYDQGFNDKEIDRLEKEATKKTIFRGITGDTSV